MAAPFNDHEQQAIKQKLINTAKTCIHQSTMQATTIKYLTQQSNISSGAFYNFFDSKEELFFEATFSIHEDLETVAMGVLAGSTSGSIKKKVPEAFEVTFNYVESSNLLAFFHDELPIVLRKLSLNHTHANDSAISERDVISKIIRSTGTKFKVPEEVVITAIHIIFYSLPHKNDFGDHYKEGIRLIIQSVCDQIVE